MITESERMARSKKTDGKPEKPVKPSTEKYRKPFTPVRIRAVIADIAKEQAAEIAQDLAQYVNDAVRMRLQSEGAWPPKPKS
jgi:hypothetical protein